MEDRMRRLPKFDVKAIFNPVDYQYFYENSIGVKITEKQIKFLLDNFKLDRPQNILDLACGHGRHANILAELGHAVTGVDITPGFLRQAKQAAHKLGVKVRYIKKDMRQISFSNEFDRVIMLFTAFGYFDDKQNLKVLHNIARALRRGGLFYFDTHNRDIFLKHFIPFMVVDKGRDMMIDRNEFDPRTGIFSNRRTIIRNGKRKDMSFFVRFYNYTEINALLNKAGFIIDNAFGDWEGAKFNRDSRRMLIIAKKR